MAMQPARCPPAWCADRGRPDRRHRQVRPAAVNQPRTGIWAGKGEPMAGLLEGRLALITGGGSGIGEGIARAMAAAGARVIVADVNAEGAARVAASIGGDAASYALDVTDRAACDALAATVVRDIGPVSVLVNNAGIIRRAKVTDPATRALWDATM